MLSVVVPVYREETTVEIFLRRLKPVLESLTADFEIIFALDPSDDRTAALITTQHAADVRIKLLRFTRRFGQPMATLTGLSHARGAAVIVMDVDLQDPPEVIPKMVACWRSGLFDVVTAERTRRAGDTWPKRYIAALGYFIIRRLSEVPIPPHTGDFRLMSRRVVDEVLKLKESHGFLRGMVAWVGYPQCSIQFARPERSAGKSHYPRYTGSLRIGLNGVVCFSNSILSLSWICGLISVALSLMMSVTVLAWKCTRAGSAQSTGVGTLIILVAMMFFGGVQLISVGILGEYIGRIYDEVRERPRTLVDLALGLSSPTTPLRREPGGFT